jgi:large subunit ribosomal protein L18
MADKFKKKAARATKRRRRVRGNISGSADIPRLTVAKSHKNICIQIIDDLATDSKAMSGKFDDKDSKIDKAKKVGQSIAELALEKGIKKVVFDRNQYRYHGRVKAAAEGARDKGLEF